jgi:hypothetical protein
MMVNLRHDGDDFKSIQLNTYEFDGIGDFVSPGHFLIRNLVVKTNQVEARL